MALTFEKFHENVKCENSPARVIAEKWMFDDWMADVVHHYWQLVQLPDPDPCSPDTVAHFSRHLAELVASLDRLAQAAGLKLDECLIDRYKIPTEDGKGV